MTKFVSAFEDFFKSIYELFASIIGSLASVVNAFISTIINFFSGIVNLFADVLKGAVNVVGGIGKFITGKQDCASRMEGPANMRRFETDRLDITGNIVVIGVIAAAGYLYVRSQQGKPVVPAKKTN